MKTSEPLQLVAAGSLPRPGPIGRLIRLAIGMACLYALWAVVHDAGVVAMMPFSTLESRFTLLLPPLCMFNYVVNIGFAKDWGARPLFASIGVLVVAAALAWLLAGQPDSPILGVPLNLWLAYFYAHLGGSFVLAAIIATPGCEMRAMPSLLGRLAGKPGAEHHCPAAFLTAIDAWEQRRDSD